MMPDTIILHGIPAADGIALGTLRFLKKQTLSIPKYTITDAEAEVQRFEKARQTAIFQLAQLYSKATEEVGAQNSLLFQIHQMMLEDTDYLESVTNCIRSEQLNAEFAVQQTMKQFEKQFSEMDDEYMRGRAADVRDISERVIHVLTGTQSQQHSENSPYILAAEDLTPSETVQLDKDKILAFITINGSASSHTAILAKSMGIPAIVGLGASISSSMDNAPVIVDGTTGTLIIYPDQTTQDTYLQKQQDAKSEETDLLKFLNEPTITKDGKQILLYANIASPEDLSTVQENGAEGIGLFRSEFLYLNHNTYPTEEEQFLAYKTAAEKMGEKRVIIRTLDIGADKQADYFELPKEDNPALGMRAIRICLTRPELFKTQLRALYRASAYGHIAIMFPMITSMEEIQQIKQIVTEVQKELTSQEIPFNSNTELGIMIETPAAALISDHLAKEVDFFSIGTNDLTQYTLAIDRQNPALTPFLNTHHPAVLRLIQMTVENAHKHGIWAGICGELGADASLLDFFLSIQLDELSVSPHSILKLRAETRKKDTSLLNVCF